MNGSMLMVSFSNAISAPFPRMLRANASIEHERHEFDDYCRVRWRYLRQLSTRDW